MCSPLNELFDPFRILERKRFLSSWCAVDWALGPHVCPAGANASGLSGALINKAPGRPQPPPSPLEEAVPAAAPPPGWRCQVALGVSNELHHA
jgi:hypothetical protein